MKLHLRLIVTVNAFQDIIGIHGLHFLTGQIHSKKLHQAVMLFQKLQVDGSLSIIETSLRFSPTFDQSITMHIHNSHFKSSCIYDIIINMNKYKASIMPIILRRVMGRLMWHEICIINCLDMFMIMSFILI